MELNITTARRLYKDSPEWFQNILIEEFGEKNLKQKDFEMIRSFEDACKLLKIKPESVFYSADTSDEIAYKKLKVIISAINNNWIPDWNDGDQEKWWPWFNLSSGFGFSHSGYFFGNARTHVGSRLCFESKEKSDYAAQQFIDLYKDFLT